MVIPRIGKNSTRRAIERPNNKGLADSVGIRKVEDRVIIPPIMAENVYNQTRSFVFGVFMSLMKKDTERFRPFFVVLLSSKLY